MKKVILLLVLAASFTFVKAQTAMGDGNLYFNMSTTAADTASAAGTWSKSFYPNCTFGLFHSVALKITEVSATTSTVCVWRVRTFPTQSWTTLNTITYKGTGSDTTMFVTEVSNKKYGMEYGWLITPANGKVRVTTAQGKFWK